MDTYPMITDPVRSPNANGTLIKAMRMEEKLLVVNDMKFGNSHFKSKLTYKQASVWKSVLDFCIVSIIN